ncbi:CDP-alcohol phosphatidyltransferase family protein [Nocardioides zeae]|uniref:CDP-alcohol phosphatidyltransferase family protein n=1 Tax=Nocardioides imazamoxiresistens TaxID=3231893 RepID=A0ABU3PQI9_9ACTN|nr:CDP-alcohol phosphatidyltransferase family protein [Nocardioides zeae]MDT9591463.1 CDP-alcohol phosphatidyltransferase family protein [Nocardioides zeae]
MSRGAAEHEVAYDLWSRLHGGLDPRGSFWVSGWVRLTHAGARPLARVGVHPDAVTLAGVLLTATVPLVAALGGIWPLVAVVPLVVAAVLDGVDGALAAQTGTASARGRVLDALADRCSDLLLVLTLLVLGAPGWLVAALAVATLLLEYARSVAQAAGMPGAGAVTVWERPSRVIVTSFAAASCAAESVARSAGVDVLPAVDADVLALVGAAVGLALALAAGAQLTRGVARDLPRGPVAQAQAGGPTSPATMPAESSTSGSPPPGWDDPPTR